MNTETVDRQFAALQSQADQTATLIRTLGDKLSAAAAAGDTNAREWGLDLKEIALAIRDEQTTTTELLQAIHGLVDDHVTSAAQPAAPQEAYSAPATYAAPLQYPQASQYQQPPQYQRYQQSASSGGTLQRFLSGRFGQAMVTGAGIGIGDDIVNSIFDRF
ncbi:hypothetical protein H7J86_29065 [Mycobacterium hackensackense]|uniref:hypothetical protein n=1 Tax=Mycobacterium hackensackense TaxID=228909 RepID=UPI002265DB99|nr:hypothetical protein [Mycobacterium hackensackense]MCV7256231.1 hypothetical protein [Mycobacterium hackensackense]